MMRGAVIDVLHVMCRKDGVVAPLKVSEIDPGRKMVDIAVPLATLHSASHWP